MEHLRRPSAALALASILAGCARPPISAGAARTESGLACVDALAAGAPTATLEWMIGTWVADAGGSTTRERWCPGAGGVLVGESETLADGAVVHRETLRIEAREGALVYVASPSGQATTEFVGDARCSSEGPCERSCEVTFENPQHDFPTEIAYASCVSSGEMVATIRGGDRSASWTFTRAAE